MQRLKSFHLPVLALLIFCSGCDKRGPLRTQLELVETELKSKKAHLVTLQEESKASMGVAMATGQTQIDRLNKEAAALKASIEELKQQKQTAEKRNVELRAEVDAYLAKHTKL